MDKSALAAARNEMKNEKPTASITSDLSHIAPMSFIQDSASFLKDPSAQQRESKQSPSRLQLEMSKKN